MAPGCFSGLWCFRQPPSPYDDGIVSPVLASAGATQLSAGGVQDAVAIETTRPRSPSSTGNADIPVPAPTQGSLPGSTGVHILALTEAQPTGQHSSEGDANIPVLAHAEEDYSAPPMSCPTYGLDPEEAKKHIDRIPRFRILVMGRANAGKTTILKRVCNTTEEPEIFNGEGQKLDATVVQGSLSRGLHDIELELVFRSNPRFVFHDSRGFEAGTQREFDLMKKFVMDRAKSAKLNERIHAIWFCIPLTDSHRLVMTAEKKFFGECDTGHVPVIVLLTKADALRLDAVQVLMSKGESLDDAMKAAAKEEGRIVDDCLSRVKGWLKDQKFPPCDYLTLGGMQQEGVGCTSLLTCTADALKEQGLQQLPISTQQSNLELCMKFAITKTLRKCMSKHGDKIEPMTLAFLLALWFPFEHEECFGGLFAEERQKRFRQQEEFFEERGQEFYKFFGEEFEGGELRQREFFEEFRGRGFRGNTLDVDLISPISHVTPSLNMPILSTMMDYSMCYVAEHGIGSILVLEYLYFLFQGRNAHNSLQQHLTLAVERYQSSGVHTQVNMLIQKAFQKYGEDVETLCPILVSIAEENQLSKVLNWKRMI